MGNFVINEDLHVAINSGFFLKMVASFIYFFKIV